MADLSVAIGTLTLRNPVLPASGTFGEAYGRVFDISRLGALVPKTVTLRPRPGHRGRRLAETAGGLINAIGIPSDGSDGLAEFVARYASHGPPVVLSVSADTVDEFAQVTALAAATRAAAIELNLSCPNLEEGGRVFALEAETTAAALSACRRVTDRPLWAKLSPNAGRPGDVAAAAQAAGADALIVANTVLALALGQDGDAVLGNRTGGLSGRPVKPITLRLVDEIARRTGLPIIGCGGVSTLRDVLDYMAAGASAVAVGTATLARPHTMVALIDALDAHCSARDCAARDLCHRPGGGSGAAVASGAAARPVPARAAHA